MESIFSELSLVIAVTAGVSILMHLIRQPLILGYILAGLIVGPTFLGLIHSTELFEAFSELGIALLLFIIGLGMNIGELRKLGRVVVFTALSSLAFVTLLGYATTSALGFTKTEAFIAGLALFFSSTIIIIKILSDKKEQNRLHGQIAIGVILLEDIIATFALLFIAAGKGGSIELATLGGLLLKGSLLLAVLAFCSIKILPHISRYMAKTQELLFLSAIAWGFGVATVFEKTGFSIEVGALFAGVALASSPYVQEIAARLKPLRDFFIVLFFITLGESMDLTNLGSSIVPALILSAIVIVAKPFIVTTTMGMLGYTKRISFKTGINLSQISEFSIILVVLAVSENLVRPEFGGIITLVAIITIATSTYLMQYDEALFRRFDRIKLHLFERDAKFHERRSPTAYQMILFGYHHGGHEFIRAFKDMRKRFLVVDYDPEVIDLLDHQKIDYLYGDATDLELLDEAGVDKAKLIVSTINDHPTNMFLVDLVEKKNPEAAFVCHADNIRQAAELYEAGASYVMIPHHIGSERMSAFIKRKGADKTEFKRYRQKHMAFLEAHLAPIDKN
jgi:Kef-type K+ transport system membrane component KefB/Trk K+ transport system NAD-binding subunit